jgi:Ca-activated chloride channel family protein
MSFFSTIVFAALPFCLLAILWAFWRSGAASGPLALHSAAERWVRGGTIAAERRIRRRLPQGLLLGVGALLVVGALARPQWGSEPEVTFDQAREVVLALDLSQSMLADDIAPNRLERSKLLIESLLGELQGERVGLVLFSGTAFLQVPLSSDYEVMREILPELTPSYLPQGGTDFTALLRTAVRSFHDADGEGERFLIVLSDGEAHEESWRTLLPTLREKGIRVVSLGVGTPEGALVPDGAGGFVKAGDGSVVLSRLAPGTLEALAQETGGVYSDASAWVDIAQIVDATVEQGVAGDFVEETQLRLQDRFQWLLGPGILFLLLAFWRELPVNPVARPIRHVGRGKSPQAGVAAAISLGILLSGSLGAKAQPPPPEALPEASLLEATVSQMVAQSQLGASDYEQLARASVAHLETPSPKADIERIGVADDALSGVDQGEALDPEAADWGELRKQLAALRESPSEPSSDSQPEEGEESQGESGESESQSGSEAQEGESDAQSSESEQSGESSPSESGNQDDSKGEQDGDASSEGKDSQGSEDSAPGQEAGSQAESETEDGEAGESDQASSEQTDPGHSQGEVPRSDDEDLSQSGVGFGEMSDDDTLQDPDATEPDAQQGSEPQPESRLVGGGTGDSENAALRQAFGGAVGRMESVRKQDAPAVLFQRMQRAEEPSSVPRNQNKKDW